MNTMRKSCRGVATATVAALIGWSPAIWAAAQGGGGTCISVPGGASSNWSLCDSVITSNVLPVGGTCTSGAIGAGASVEDATLGTRGDAFDELLIFVNNTQVGGTGALSGNGVLFAGQTIAGLNTQLRWDVLTTEATARGYLSLTNPTGAPITVTVDYLTNFGSDSGTILRGSSSGDTTFTTADRWLVSSDGSPTSGDPVNTTVLWGGTPAVTPSSVSNTVFDCAATNGARATYSVTVPAGTSRALLFFQRLSDSDVTALATASSFDNVVAGSPLLAGLSGAQTAAVQNFGIGGGTAVLAAVPVGGQWSAVLAALLALVGATVFWRRRHGAR